MNEANVTTTDITLSVSLHLNFYKGIKADFDPIIKTLHSPEDLKSMIDFRRYL